MKEKEDKKKALIIGAGPAGLTVAYELLKQSSIQPHIIEETNDIGGIARTVKFNNNLMDIGPHRFFSKRDDIMDWWENILPFQGVSSIKDTQLKSYNTHKKDGPDPDTKNRVMLVRRRITRIFYLRRFFDYPISLKLRTFVNLGLLNSINVGIKYLWVLCFKRKEDSLENFFINRFGKPLYKMFFENYTQKVWGIHPSALASDWGSQRVKDISLLSVLINKTLNSFLLENITGKKKRNNSISEYFLYPKFGSGQMWETVADEIISKGGGICKNKRVSKINVKNDKVNSVVVNMNGIEETISCDYLFSSMPISELIPAIQGIEVPDEIKSIATDLPYRAHITVGIIADKLISANATRIMTKNRLIPDNWIYVQENDVKMGRIYIVNNFSPYMVPEFENKIMLGIEYFCDEGDELWQMDEKSFINMTLEELEKIQMMNKESVLEAFQIKIKKAYPSYFGSYSQLDHVIKFLNKIENLYCIGRNGQHRYNNMDHSMLTAIEAVKHLVAEKPNDKSVLWNVNAEREYHEHK
ncbi:NAD(P)/FAD-dependent oxidoreductase [candidate division KSB1 bacterium]